MGDGDKVDNTPLADNARFCLDPSIGSIHFGEMYDAAWYGTTIIPDNDMDDDILSVQSLGSALTVPPINNDMMINGYHPKTYSDKENTTRLLSNPASVLDECNLNGHSVTYCGWDDGDSIQHEEGHFGTVVQEHSFPFKLFHLLQHAEENGKQHIVSWVEDGCALKVHDHRAFVSTILPNYFDHNKYESFRRQLNLYGFTRISSGSSRGIYFHPLFLKSDRWMCQYVSRIVQPKK